MSDHERPMGATKPTTTDAHARALGLARAAVLAHDPTSMTPGRLFALLYRIAAATISADSLIGIEAALAAIVERAADCARRDEWERSATVTAERPTPKFRGLTPSALGLLATWSDGAIAVMESRRDGIGYDFHPVSRAVHPDATEERGAPVTVPVVGVGEVTIP